MDALLKKIGESGVFTACSVGLLNSDGVKQTWSYGRATSQSLFDCASLTKVWPTGELVAMAMRDKLVREDDVLADYLAETTGTPVGKLTLHDLQNYLVEWKITLSQQKHLSARELLEKLVQTSVFFSQEPVYSNATSIFLGLVLEQVCGKRLDALANEKLFSPLQLSRTGFFPKEIDDADILPSEKDNWRGREIRGEVHDESAWILQQDGLIPGSAGLFSCVDDLLTLAQWQLSSSYSNGKGWEQRTAEWIGAAASKNAYGKTGFTGCSVVMDPQKNAAAIILSNAIYPHRPQGREAINAVRRQLNDALLTRA